MLVDTGHENERRIDIKDVLHRECLRNEDDCSRCKIGNSKLCIEPFYYPRTTLTCAIKIAKIMGWKIVE